MKAIEQHATKIELKNIQEFHDSGYTIKEKRYPNLPEEFEDGGLKTTVQMIINV